MEGGRKGRKGVGVFEERKEMKEGEKGREGGCGSGRERERGEGRGRGDYGNGGRILHRKHSRLATRERVK